MRTAAGLFSGLLVGLALLFLAAPSSGQSNRTVLPIPLGLFGVGFIFNGKIDDFGFTSTIDQARVAMVKHFGRDKMLADYVPESITDVNFTIASDQCKAAVTQFHDKGYTLIIAPSLFTSCLQWAVATYPSLYAFKLGGISSSEAQKYPRLAGGFPRMHEARYISGLVAGAFTKTGKIGYITASGTSNPQTRYIAAMYSGARRMNPNIQFYVYDVNGFDNTTNQAAAATELIEKYDCDILATNVNPLTVQYTARDLGKKSIFSDGDGRILVGESVLTSIIYSWTDMFISVVNNVQNNTFAPIFYNVGYPDGANGVAPFGNDYYADNEARSRVEPIIVEAEALLRSRQMSGVCNVSDFGFRHAAGSDCMSEADVIGSYWNFNMTVLAARLPGMIYLGRMVVPINDIYVRYTDGVAQAFVAIAAIVLAATVGLSIFIAVLYKKGSMVIKYSSPPFMYLINSGILLLCIAVFIMGGNHPHGPTCDASLWLTALGVSMMYSAILSKAGRLWFILKRASKLQKVTLPNKVLFIGFIIQVCVVLIILVLGTALSPFQVIEVKDARLPINTVYVFCTPSKTIFWPLAIVVYQAALAAVGLFFAFKTRHLFDELNESREITLVTYNLLFVGIIIILLLYITNPTPAAAYAIEVVGILWTAIVTLVIVYFPKIYHVITGHSMHSSTGVSMMGRTGTAGTGNKNTSPSSPGSGNVSPSTYASSNKSSSGSKSPKKERK